MIKIKIFNFSLTIYSIFFLVFIFQYYCNVKVNNDNLKAIQELKNGRVLAEKIANGTLNQLNLLFKSIENGLPDKINSLYYNFSVENALEFYDWMYNKSRNITYALNVSPDYREKGILNNVYSLLNKLTEELLIDSSIKYYINKIMFNGSNPTTDISTLQASSSSPTTLPTSASTSLLSTTTDILQTALSATTETPFTSISTTTSAIPVEKAVSDVCEGFFCGSTPAIAFSTPIGIIGGLLLFVYIYKNSRIRSMLRGINPFEKKAKKRQHEPELGDVENISKNSEETGRRKPKRSRLASFLRAFGYNFKFPFIDEDASQNEELL